MSALEGSAARTEIGGDLRSPNPLAQGTIGRKSLSAAIRAWLGDRFQSRPSQLCLISGSPRSGTTAMYAWLSEHSQVAAVTESRILVAAHAFVQQTRRFKRLNRYRDPLTERVRRLVLEHYAERNPLGGRTLIIDKEPLEPIAFPNRQYVDFLEDVRSLFPAAKFLFLVRDPLATIWSMRERKWGFSLTAAEPRAFSLEEHTQNWCDCAEVVLRFAADPQCHVCSFEKLVRDPVQTSRDLYRFLELPHGPPFQPTPVKTIGFTEQERRQILEQTRSQVEALRERNLWHPVQSD